MTEVFHPLTIPQEAELRHFTNPFAYIPTAECVTAAAAVRAYVSSAHPEWADELSLGKMFGVLVCKSPDGETGFLAAFSGTVAGRLTHEWFVPPVLDFERPDGVFKTEEGAISEINRQINLLASAPDFTEAKGKLSELRALADAEIRKAKDDYALHRQERRELRSQHPDKADELDRQSQFEKAEIKRLSKRWEERIAELQSVVYAKDGQIKNLKEERVRRSNVLQRWLFSRMRLHCADGCVVSVHDIFSRFTHTVPPSGSGDCCAPRLLNFAFANGFRPISMAEFWVGQSPRGEIRVDGQFYPACQPKCAPLLRRMLMGSDFEPDQSQIALRLVSSQKDAADCAIEVLWEDDWLLAVNKPSGLITVSDNPGIDSLMRRVLALRPDITGPGYVHRLDQPTSGIVLIAKDKSTHQLMQSLFESRQVKKRYVALLDGRPKQLSGEVSLPLLPNPDDRPRQMVDFIRGKAAVTIYEVKKSLSDSHGQMRTLIFFYPQTGRTHQLRVHAASPLGLGCPIVGDNLYGRLAERLMLHADRVEFTHPRTSCEVVVSCPAPECFNIT